MNLDQLKYLADLAKTSSMNTTAKRMFISQQALSESIKRLENELDCTLLLRSKTGIEFTDDGKVVLDCAQHMLKHYNEMNQYLQTKYHKNHLQGKLTIGVAPVATSSFLPELLVSMHAHYPNIALYVHEYTPASIFDLLAKGRLDFGLFGFSRQGGIKSKAVQDELMESFQFQKLYKDHLVCAMAKNNPLSVQTSFTFEQLSSVKQTMYAYDNIAKTEGFYLHVSNNTEIHQQFMREEGTICCIPFQMFQTHYAKKDFICRPIVNAAPITTYLVCKKNPDLLDSPICHTFIETTLSLVPTIHSS